ncbi:sensor histidine kinase [Erythrobacter sp. HKB08]|uniref:sensor histidine kinase n=1 Tax=Erythrobacter sp. HKB08 TaxID=2502843 RepID=UPI001008B8A6|nr:GAF domain-containing protein [Erythrobacter sp. HKB08]
MRSADSNPWPHGEPPDPAYCGEATRASVLATYQLDALQDDPELAEISQFAAKLCDAPIALVTLVEEERQRFLARAGLEDRETPRPTSFCAHAMMRPEVMVVPDAREDERFASNPLVTGHPHIRFYAGAPLVSQEGAPLGALCIIDTEPRPDGLSDFQVEGLRVLASGVMRRLRQRREALVASEEREAQSEKNRKFADAIPSLAFTATPDGRFDYINRRWREYTGWADDEYPAPGFPNIHDEDRAATIEIWRKAVSSQEAFEAEFRYKRHDGVYRWMLARAVPAKTKSGRVLRWFGTLTDIDDLRTVSEQRDLLARELKHRIKNIFAVVGGLISLKSREWPEAAPFVEDITKTLATLGRAHDYVTPASEGRAETLHGLLGSLLDPYRVAKEPRLSIDGSDHPVGPKAATPLALVFHELATNSAKYGALSAPKGRVIIECRITDDTASILWSERGGPAVKPPETTGFGSRLIEMTVSSQLRGTLERDFGETGLVATLTIPTSSL